MTAIPQAEMVFSKKKSLFEKEILLEKIIV